MRPFTGGRYNWFWLPLLFFFIPGACQGEQQATSEPCPFSTPGATVPATRPPGEPLLVPPGRPPVIDGTIEPAEWVCAVSETFADGSELLLMHDDGYLYLAVRAAGPEMIISNVHLEQAGEVSVLHVSTALGTAAYQSTAGEWIQVRDYEWCCRGSQDDDDAAADRQALLQEDGWLAANSRLGEPNEAEYQIAIPDGPLRLAVVFMRVPQPNVCIPWPAGLIDDCIAPGAAGFLRHAHFSPESWAAVEFQAIE
jgi:hypothetical protein